MPLYSACSFQAGDGRSEWFSFHDEAVCCLIKLACSFHVWFLFLLRKSKFLPKSVLEQFYFSIILPSITYGLVIWANGSNSELFKSIDKLHGRAAKLIYNLGNDTSYEDALKIAKWHSLAYIYKIKLFKLMHNAYNDRLPVPLSDNIVTKRNTEYSLRRPENIAVPRFQSRYL